MSSVMAYANSQVGRKVGDGECTRLAEQALKSAGMKTTNDFGVTGKTADYVWGMLVSEDDAKPGDILQFRDHVMTVTTVKDEGGQKTKTYNRGHHTAIIASKNFRTDDWGRVYFSYSILEQHTSGKYYVHKDVIQLRKSVVKNDTTGEEITTESYGKVLIYRPVAK